MKIKICKYKLMEYKSNMFIQIRFTLLGFIFRNTWTIHRTDFFNEKYKDWIPCYIELTTLLLWRFRR